MTQEIAQVLRLEDVKAAVPPTHRQAVTQSLVDKLNALATNPEAAEAIKENFATYSGVLKDGKHKIDEYLNAVMYVSYKIMGYNNEESYAKTFPERHARLVANGTAKKDIAAYVSAYNKGKLVNNIYERTMIPIHVLNQDALQKAINTQVSLMENSTSDLVRTQAANSLLTHLKQPEASKNKIEINISESQEMRSMKAMIEELAERQQRLIESGEMTTIDVTATNLIRKFEDAEVIDVS